MWERTGGRLLCAPVGEVTPRVDILGPNSRCWGGVLYRLSGVSTWMPLANSEGSCPPPCVLNKEQ